MKATLAPGLQHRFTYRVPSNKTVPHLYPEVADFREMPAVFATGFMVGLMEWTCMQLIEPHLDVGEGSLGVHIDVSHTAATPAGLEVTVDAECVKVEGRRISFKVQAHDGIDSIGEGRHQRFVIEWGKFNERLRTKTAKMKREVANG